MVSKPGSSSIFFVIMDFLSAFQGISLVTIFYALLLLIVIVVVTVSAVSESLNEELLFVGDFGFT